MKKRKLVKAQELHQNVPPDWYVRSIKENIFQRFWHKRRFAEVAKLVEPIKGELLDIGSADGEFTRVLARKSGAKKIVGIDVLPESVAFAKKRFSRWPKYSFRVADAHKLPFGDARFGAVFCLEAIEHVIHPRMVLSEMYRVLSPGGYAVVLVPVEKNRLFKIIWWGWIKWRGKIWRGTHLSVFDGGDLGKLFRRAGFGVEEEKRFLLGMLLAVKGRKRR